MEMTSLQGGDAEGGYGDGDLSWRFIGLVLIFSEVLRLYCMRSADLLKLTGQVLTFRCF